MLISLVFLIEQVSNGLYILLGLAVLIFWRRWVRARGEYRATHYELEREIARYHQANAVTALILVLELILVVLGIQRVVAPTIRSTTNTVQFIAPLEDLPFYTPTPSTIGAVPIDPSGVEIGEDDPAQRVLATPTLTPTPVGTIEAAPPAVGCDTPDATLQIPANGMVVFEPINVVGSASTANFAFYRFEINGPGTFGNFALLQQYTLPVSEIGDLGQFVPSFYDPGEYQFRLTVFDLTLAVRASCTVTIFMRRPLPTATPLSSQ